MSDSGRRLGDCKHAKSREWCVECLRADLQAAKEAERWRPIATAPKDETRILVYATLRGCSLGGHDRGKDYGKFVVIAYWDKHYETWIDGSQCTPEPTHWCPLPEPPQEARTPCLTRP